MRDGLHRIAARTRGARDDISLAASGVYATAAERMVETKATGREIAGPLGARQRGGGEGGKLILSEREAEWVHRQLEVMRLAFYDDFSIE